MHVSKKEHELHQEWCFLNNILYSELLRDPKKILNTKKII